MTVASDDEPAVLPLRAVQQLLDAQEVIRSESEALLRLADSLDASFCDAVELIAATKGSVIVTGVGKAGLIGRKVVATLASTGTRAWFLHPTEAVHGDLGCVTGSDIVLAISNSGASDEIVRLIPTFQKLQVPIIAMTRDRQNVLAQSAQIVLELGRHREAGELQLAPTVSTSVMLALGDALALTLSKVKGFSENQFAVCHPAGSLGRKLTPVSEVMRSGSELRIAEQNSTVRQVMVQLGRPGRRTGAIVLVNSAGSLAGIFTDSDLARLFEQRRDHLIDGPISAVMTAAPTTIPPTALLPEVVRLMSDRKISELPVVSDRGRPLGLVDITDIIDAPSTPDDSSVSAPLPQPSTPPRISA